MQWTDISIPFFEDNAAFFLPFLNQHQHGTWVESELFGPLLCCLYLETPAASYEGKTLVVFDDIFSRSISCWSANRRFKSAMSICSHKSDIEVSANYMGDGEWEMSGRVRTEFLNSKAGSALKQKLMIAQLKEQKLQDKTGRIFGAKLKI